MEKAKINKETNEFLSAHVTYNNHNRGLPDLVCLCNPLILLEGSSDNLENVKASKTSLTSTVSDICGTIYRVYTLLFVLYTINEEIQMTREL